MHLPTGWMRLSSGFHRVASDGAYRMTQAMFSKDSQSMMSAISKHLPELATSIFIKRADESAQFANQAQQIQRVFDASDGGSSSFGIPTHGGINFTNQGNMDGIELLLPNDHRGGASSFEKEETRVSNCFDTSGGIDQLGSSRDSHLGRVDHAAKTYHDSKLATGMTRPTPDSFDETEIAHIHDNDVIYDKDYQHRHLPEGSAVPSTRLSRAFGFASLGAGLAVGTVAEFGRRAWGQFGSRDRGDKSTDHLILSNDANAQRLTHSLRRMRGAAMKLGQMLSIQDESIAPPALTTALAQVRKGAEAMPSYQLQKQLRDQWGEGWKDRIDLEERPFAAASIGQVHRATLLSPSESSTRKVAVKVQYPGVADSIESDLSNLSMLVKVTGLAPHGLFLDNIIRVGRDELKVECDYRREAANQKKFSDLISSDPELVSERFVVPGVVEEFSTDRILVTEYVRGGTIDKVEELDQFERNRIGRAILRLTMLELFVWRFMQTDPNWGNFLYDMRTQTTYLIDFGAAREYEEEFVRGYLNIVVANANRDEASLIEESVRMGFLTGEENRTMLEAHKSSGFCLGEPFQSYEPYDFKSSKITSRISEHGSVFLKHRLTPPPEEVYTLHRKLAGAYNLCIKLGATISCRNLLDEVVHHFVDP